MGVARCCCLARKGHSMSQEDTQVRSGGHASGQGTPQASLASFLLPLALIIGLVLLLSLDVDQAGEAAEQINPLEVWVGEIVGYLIACAELCAALVIGIAVVQGISVYLSWLVTRKEQPLGAESVRLRLGRMLALGLEFTVASDILSTVVAPNRQDILNLGAVVLLRTLLIYFLEREIREGEAHSRSSEKGV